jgi:hypothetical protein
MVKLDDCWLDELPHLNLFLIDIIAKLLSDSSKLLRIITFYVSIL